MPGGEGKTGLPFGPTGLDVELLAAAGAAMARRVPLGVVLPLLGTPTAVVLGAASVVGAVLHRGKVNVRVAVSSPRLGDRLWYDQFALGTQRLADFVPRASVAADGTVRVLNGPTSEMAGRLYLTSRVDRLKGVRPQLEGVITDADACTQDELLDLLSGTRRRPPVIYLTTDPSDPRLVAVREAGGAVWGWDAACLAALAVDAVPRRTAHAGPLVASTVTLHAAADASVSIHVPRAPSELDDALDRLWRAIGHLAAAHNTSAAGLHWAWGLFNTLAMLPVPPTQYDSHAAANPYVVSLTAAPDTARAFARVAGGRAGDAWYATADATADANRAADAQPRTPHLVDWVAERADVRQPGVILTGKCA